MRQCAPAETEPPPAKVNIQELTLSRLLYIGGKDFCYVRTGGIGRYDQRARGFHGLRLCSPVLERYLRSH